MSHVTAIDLIIQDLFALKAGASDLGLVIHDRNTYKWYNRHVGDYPIPEGLTAADLGKCLFAIGRADGKGYEVGVIKNPTGPGYKLIYDFFGSQGKLLEEKIGKGAGLLKQSYATRVATHQARAQGFQVRRHVTSDGTVKLSLTK